MKNFICILLLLNVELICSSEDIIHKSNVSAIKEEPINNDGFRTDDTTRSKFRDRQKRQRSPQNSNTHTFRHKISQIGDLIDEREQNAFITSQEELPFFRSPNQPRPRRPPLQEGYASGVVTPEYTVKQGRLIGIFKHMPVRSGLKSIQQFLGIPYAESPTGSR